MTPVCITAHDLPQGTTRVFKDGRVDPQWGAMQSVWKVAAATAAAPTYLEPAQVGNSDSHVDGGVWANNPAIVGVVEAVRYFDRSLSDIRLLSVGSTSRIFRVSSHRAAQRLGLVGWAFKTIDLLLGTVSMASHRQTQLLLGDGQYLRIDDEIVETYPVDDVERCRPLRDRGKSKALATISDVERVLGVMH